MLEDVANGTTALFGPTLARSGVVYPNLESAVQSWMAKNEVEDFTQAVDGMLGQGYSFVVQKNPRDLSVYSKNPQVFTDKGPDTVRTLFNLSPEAQVTWKQSYQSAGHTTPLDTVFVEQKDENPPENPAENRAENPAQLSVSFGFTVRKQSEEPGATILAVDTGGPSARFGLKAGDRIVSINRFETSQGHFGPWKIANLEDFKRAARYMQPGWGVPLQVIRGGSAFHVAVIPTESGKQEPNKSDLRHLTVDEISRAKKVTPQATQELLRKTGSQAKDYAPNPPEPGYKTGNYQANVSSLT